MLIAYTGHRFSDSLGEEHKSKGYDHEGYNSKGFNQEGYNRKGYDKLDALIDALPLFIGKEIFKFIIPDLKSVCFGFPQHYFPAYNSIYKIAKCNNSPLVKYHSKFKLYLHRRNRGKKGYKYYIVRESEIRISPKRPSCWYMLRNASDYEDEIHCVYIKKEVGNNIINALIEFYNLDKETII